MSSEVGAERVGDDDLVGNELAAAHVQRRRRLGDRDQVVDRRVDRDVVVEQLGRARAAAVVEREVQVVGRPGRARRRGRRGRLRLRLAEGRRERLPRRPAVPGQPGTENGGVDGSVAGGISVDTTGALAPGSVTREQERAAARARRVGEVQVELVEAARERHLALLHGIDEAARGQRQIRCPPRASSTVAPAIGRARDLVVHHAVRVDRQVQVRRGCCPTVTTMSLISCMPVRERRRP